MLYAYIDESGQRGHGGRASRHFVMSAVMWRSHTAEHAVDLLRRVRKATGRGPDHLLHFSRLDDEHRVTASAMIGRCRWLMVSTVVVCKDYLDDTLPDDTSRYLFPFRLLLERISWVARDSGETAQYTLSHVQRIKLSQLRDYERRVRLDPENRVAWDHLDPGGGKLNQPRVLEQLQLADLVASSCGIAFNPPENTGQTVDTYLRAFRPRLYQPPGKQLTSYGLKMHPWKDETRAAYRWVTEL